MKPHKCPVCNGTGLVSIPPDIPGDTGSSTTTSDNPGPFTCKACHGACIIWEQDPVSIPSVWIPPNEEKPVILVYGDPVVPDGYTYTITTDGTSFPYDNLKE